MWNLSEEFNDLKVMIESMKREGKSNVAGVEKAINSLDNVLHWCEKWKRNILLGLCPKCRNKNERHNLETSVDGIPTVKGLQLIIEVKEDVFKKNYDEMKDKELKLKSKITHLKEENELFQRKLAALGQDHTQTLENVKKLKSENEQLQSKLSQAIFGCHDSLDIQGDIKVRSAQWKTTEENMTAQIADLTDQLAQEKLNKRDDLFRKQIELTAKDEELYQVKMELADEKSSKLENKKLLDQIKTLQSDMNSKDEEFRQLCMELEEAKQQKKRDIVLGIRSERSGMGKTMVEMVTRELTEQLKNTLDRQDIRLTVTPCQTSADIPRGMMAVLCLDMSRVGTNIKDALTGIKANRDVFVIVFHHTNKENLSSLTPTSLRITGSELRQLGAIIDMVFSSEGGIYRCDINNTAVENIAKLISRYF